MRASGSNVEPTVEALVTKSREAILAITDRLLKVVPPDRATSPEENGEIERLLNRLTWHLGLWKSYGTNDTAKRTHAAQNQIARLTLRGYRDGWTNTREQMVHVLQSVGGMALLIDRGRLNPLLIRELYAQVDADLKAVKMRFSAKATRV